MKLSSFLYTISLFPLVANLCSPAEEPFMFKVNDFVIYGSMGVYQIVDIRNEMDIHDFENEYYILEPAYCKNLTIKIPVNSYKAMMRRVMTKEEALSLIEGMPEKETRWIDDCKERTARFKAALRTGNSEEWMQLVRTVYLEKRVKTDLGKTRSKTDADMMKAAENNLNEAFAIALNIAPGEVVPYIMKHIS